MLYEMEIYTILTINSNPGHSSLTKPLDVNKLYSQSVKWQGYEWVKGGLCLESRQRQEIFNSQKLLQIDNGAQPSSYSVCPERPFSRVQAVWSRYWPLTYLLTPWSRVLLEKLTGRHFRNKKKAYLKAKIEDLETNSKIKNIRDLYRGISAI